MTRLLAALLGLALFAGLATAGTLSPGLERQISTMNGDDEIKVFVVMKDQVNVSALDWELHSAKAPLEIRHRTVITELQDKAASTQQGLLADLAAKSAAGLVRGYTPHWLVNGVVVVTTVDGARQLAARPDVDVVEADLVVELIQPLKSQKTASPDKAIGITPGVVAVGARRVWDELGIDGTGALVGILDTGVQGTHSALSGNWRGNHAPVDECWLDAAQLGDATPIDQHYHGTHVMGTIAGLAANDTIGVAPGSEWIASNIINSGTGVDFDNGVIASLEWMADPDGDPLTSDDVPDVVQNSWGVNESFSGYVDCDSRWWSAIDACEAAGVVLTWSAGNEGPSGTTLRSPADRATTAYNCFSVGSTEHTAPYTISSFSSRGPSGCGGTYAMKPEISAPGSDIYSAEPGGGYQYLSGTSMAGPHVAGVVALMRAANPGLDVITIKQVLMDTAVDLGSSGEDNDYGHGFIDGYTAVLTVMAGFGTVEGTVTDAGTGSVIAGAAVLASAPGEVSRSLTTDANGFFSSMLPQGDWTLDVSAFGYFGDSAVVTIAEDVVSTQDFALSAAPTAVLSGFVYDDSSLPVEGATITVLNTPLAPAVSAADGAYSIAIPTGADYDVLAQAYGMGGSQITLTAFSGDVQHDFILPELTFENFESAGFSMFPWVQGGTAPWIIDGTSAQEGSYSARSGDINDNQDSQLSIELNVQAAGNIEFYYKVSSESSYDFLDFIVDGATVASWSGTVDWTLFQHNLDAGVHTIAFNYNKDGSVSSGSDAAWIDFVVFPTIVPPTYPAASWDTASMAHTLAPGATGQQTMTISNNGEGVLEIVPVAMLSPAPPQAAQPILAKGEEGTGPAFDPALAFGGPNVFGYSWIDSDEPNGPVYGWVEISGVGTPQTFSDDQSRNFTFSFPFSWFGTNYTSVNVSSNGFLSFTSTATAYSNAAIPGTADPNDLIAVMWDDFNPSVGGQIYTYDDTANQRFIVQWDAVPYYSTSDYQTFQVILNADGSILCQYETVADRASATYGIENGDASDYLAVAYNTAYAASGKALLYSFVPPPPPWLQVSAASTTILPGESTELTVTFDATELAEGLYEGHLLIATNDPDNTSIVVPAVLTVSTGMSAVGDEIPARFALGNAAPNPFNPATKISYAVPAGGAHVTLDVFDVSGRLVKRLVNGTQEAGFHSATWHGDDNSGRRAASGLYFYRLSAGDFSQTRKMVMLK
jgi:subtilisin family serine protease